MVHCVDGFINGQGKCVMYEGDKLIYTHIGNAINGKLNGQGTKTLANGGKSVGIWKDGKLFENKGEILKVKSITELLDSY